VKRSHFDLPIALALLAAMGVVDAEALADYVIVGELGLDARIPPRRACCWRRCMRRK